MQTCAKVLQSINQSRDTSGLSTVLSLLQLAWTQRLELREELCSAVLTSIYNLVSLKDVTAVINPQLVGQVFRLLSVVSSHPQQYAALCKARDRLSNSYDQFPHPLSCQKWTGLELEMWTPARWWSPSWWTEREP